MNIGGIHIEGEQELKAQILKFIIERETLFLFFYVYVFFFCGASRLAGRVPLAFRCRYCLFLVVRVLGLIFCFRFRPAGFIAGSVCKGSGIFLKIQDIAACFFEKI